MRIGNLTLNLDFYKGEAPYSDGDIENTMLDMARRGLSYEQAVAENSSWPVIYHFSPVRKNLLDWYPFPNNCSVLEIGAGCGAVTGVLCEKAGNVVAVELTKRRAEILANRHKEATNLEVIVGNLGDIKFEKKFDVVTLIGVLEYAGSFYPSQNPHHDFLAQAKSLLNEGGELIVAIENQFGLKYWAGAAEDHTGKRFDGIMGYSLESVAQTFGREELHDLITAAGFEDVQFFYPHPDYKLPVQVFSDDWLPSADQLESLFLSYEPDPVRFFHEKPAYEGIIKNGMYPFFANSFLVSCKVGGKR